MRFPSYRMDTGRDPDPGLFFFLRGSINRPMPEQNEIEVFAREASLRTRMPIRPRVGEASLDPEIRHPMMTVLSFVGYHQGFRGVNEDGIDNGQN